LARRTNIFAIFETNRRAGTPRLRETPSGRAPTKDQSGRFGAFQGIGKIIGAQNISGW